MAHGLALIGAPAPPEAISTFQAGGGQTGAHLSGRGWRDLAAQKLVHELVRAALVLQVLVCVVVCGCEFVCMLSI